MRRAAPITVLALALAAAGPASAADSFGDARGDTIGEPAQESFGAAQSGTSDVDIVRTTSATASRGRLVHTVTVAGHAADPRKGEELVPLLLLTLASYPGGSPECDFYVGVGWRGAGVYQCGFDRKLASARIERTTRSTTRYVFRASSFGARGAYGWAFGVRGRGSGTRVQFDRAPDGESVFYTARARATR